MRKLDCGHEPSEHDEHTTGYGECDGKQYCYDCCAMREVQSMEGSGRATLYDCDTEVTDWPGVLRFKVTARKRSPHNIARYRYDLWFVGPEGKEWHGVRYGDNTQIVHCRRTKKLVPLALLSVGFKH